MNAEDEIAKFYRTHGKLPNIDQLVALMLGKISKGAAHMALKTWQPKQRKKAAPSGAPVALLQGAILLVAFIAAMVSVYYSYVWLESYMLNVLAGAFAFSLVLFSSIGFTISKYVKSGLKWVILSMSVLVLLFSMICTVAGQIKISTQDKGAIENEYFTEEIELLKKQIEQQERDLETAQDLLSLFDTLEKRNAHGGAPYFNSMKDREQIQENLNALYIEYRGLVGGISDNETKESFFSFMDNIKWGQFFLYLAPALFLDIIAPLGLYVAFEIRRKNN